MTETWIAVRTQPNSEAKAAFHLRRQKFVAYVPCYAKRRSHARKVDTVRAPLFPGYIFADIAARDGQWRSIRSTAGVADVIVQGDGPAVIPAAVIHDIKAREDHGGLVRLGRGQTFSPGQTVRLIDGPFAGYDGLFEAQTDAERVSILLTILGRTVRTQTSVDYLGLAS